MTKDYILKRVERIPKLSDGNWDFDNPVVLDEAFGHNVKLGVGDIKDSLSFQLPNYDNQHFTDTNTLVEDDIVKIFQWKNSTTFSDADLLIEGTFKGINETIDTKGRVISINGFDFIEEFFNNQVATVDSSFQQKTVPEMVKAILEQSRRLTATRRVFWASSAFGWSGTANAEIKSDGLTSFPSKDFINNFRKVSDLLEELSSDKYTEDGQYVYWIEQQDVSGDGNATIAADKRRLYLLWKDTNDPILGTTLREGEDTRNLKITRDKDEVLNFIIYNAGTDLFGQPVEYFAHEPISIGKFGYKTKYMVEETFDIFNGLVQTEIAADTGFTLFTYDDDNRATSRIPQAYPYTFQFETRNADFSQTGTKQTASNDNDYNRKLSTEAEAIGYFRAMRLIERSAKPKYKVQIAYNFRTDLVRGGNYQVVVPSRNLDRQLRLMELQHTMFETTVVLEEDAKNATWE